MEQLKKGVYWTQRCADYAAQNGLMVVVEVHFDELIEDANSCLEFIAKVSRENVKLIYDAGNMFVAEVDFGPESLRNKLYMFT